MRVKDEYSILNSKHFIGIHGYMIVYSVGSKQSFDMVTIIRDKILNHLVCLVPAALQNSFQTEAETHVRSQGADAVPIMIVGNKNDIRPQLRQVASAEGQKLGSDTNCGWIESSARNNDNVGKAFEMMIAEIEKSQEPDKPPGGGKCIVM